MNIPSLRSLASSAVLATALNNACLSAGPQTVQSVPKTTEEGATSVVRKDTKAKVCNITGGPLTQCCEVSGKDGKAYAPLLMGLDGVCLHSEFQVKDFFSCPDGLRLVMDDSPKGKLPENYPGEHSGYSRWACLGNEFLSVQDKQKEEKCHDSMEPMVTCDAKNNTRTVKWVCYGGPRESAIRMYRK